MKKSEMPKFPETHLIREGGPNAAIWERIWLAAIGLMTAGTVVVLLHEILSK